MQYLLENLLCMHASEKKDIFNNSLFLLMYRVIMHNFIGTLLSSIVEGALIKDCENVIKAQSNTKLHSSKLRASKVD